MTEDICDRYYTWLTEKITDKEHPADGPDGYHILLQELWSTSFVYRIPMDGNRYEDGVDLRYRFGDEMGIPGAKIARYLDVLSCSVLEMMVALAIRCEVHIMADDEYGDRTSKWFWAMIRSMGLEECTDEHFDIMKLTSAFIRINTHSYERNGEGGLFTTKDQTKDMRNMQIWDQAMAYLVDVLDEEQRKE